jgi:transposase
MAKPSDRSPERKLQVVLSVLRGELSATEAARRCGVAEQTVHNWKRAFFGRGP